MNEPLHELLFGVRRSVRYHHRRRRFFDLLQRITAGLAVVLGSTAVISLLQQHPAIAVYAALAVTFLSALDLVIGYAGMARLHWDLARQFIELEQDIVRGADPDANTVAAWTARRLAIEADEPPVLRVLDTLCHNELARAMGYDPRNYKRVGWFQAACAPFFDWRDSAIS